ncbi:mercury resistance system transport protein MerF [Zobellella aerophila]|uniref:Mercury resistance system transport protein MerF n=1 Tax=Zobellella aerophila TaxID=870480 RepID=A0ABP6VHB7_9GAMM
MKNPYTLLGIGVAGTVVAALCCFTPILVILFGVLGLSAMTGYLDYVLFPVLAVFIALTIYAIHKKRAVDACRTADWKTGVKR